MESKEFTQLALVTESRPETLAFSKPGLHALLSVMIEAAKLADMLKRTVFYGKPLDQETLSRRLAACTGSAFAIAHIPLKAMLNPDEPASIEAHAPNLRILHAGLGVFSESGEILEALVKQIETGALDLVNVGEETGDIDWYQAILADETGVSIAQADAAVIAKLQKRYGDKFDAARALNRDLDAERQVLETKLTVKLTVKD